MRLQATTMAHKGTFTSQGRDYQAYWNGKFYGANAYITVTDLKSQKQVKGCFDNDAEIFPFGKSFGESGGADNSRKGFEELALVAVGAK